MIGGVELGKRDGGVVYLLFFYMIDLLIFILIDLLIFI